MGSPRWPRRGQSEYLCYLCYLTTPLLDSTLLPLLPLASTPLPRLYLVSTSSPPRLYLCSEGQHAVGLVVGKVNNIV